MATPKAATKPSKKSAALPSEIEHTRDELAQAGARYSASRLADGGRAILAYAAEDDAVLARFGFGAAWRSAMTARIAEVGAAASVRASTASDARPSGVVAAKLVEEGRAWLKHAGAVLAALPAAMLSSAPSMPHHAERATQLAPSIRVLAAFFSKHAKALVSFGADAAFGKQGIAIADALDAARASHKVELAKVSPEVFKLHVAEGIVALELGRLSAVAHGALPATRTKLYATTTLRPRASGKHASKGASGAGKSAGGAGKGASGAGKSAGGAGS